MPLGSVRITTTAFVRPGRSTCFARYAPTWVDGAFAAAVLTVYTSAERVPVDPRVHPAVAAEVRARLSEHGRTGGALQPPSSRPSGVQPLGGLGERSVEQLAPPLTEHHTTAAGEDAHQALVGCLQLED